MPGEVERLVRRQVAAQRKPLTEQQQRAAWRQELEAHPAYPELVRIGVELEGLTREEAKQAARDLIAIHLLKQTVARRTGRPV